MGSSRTRDGICVPCIARQILIPCLAPRLPGISERLQIAKGTPVPMTPMSIMFPIGGSSAELGGWDSSFGEGGMQKTDRDFFFLIINLLFKEESVSNSRGFLAD